MIDSILSKVLREVREVLRKTVSKSDAIDVRVEVTTVLASSYLEGS